MQIESEIATSNLKVATKSSKQIFSRNNYCIIPKVDFVKVIANSIKFINQMACGSWWFHSIQTVWSKLKASICIQIQLKSCLYLYSVCSWIHLITETTECFLFLKGFLFFFPFKLYRNSFPASIYSESNKKWMYNFGISNADTCFFMQNEFFKFFPEKNTSFLSKLGENHSICVKSNGVQWTECLSRFAHTLCWIKQ